MLDWLLSSFLLRWWMHNLIFNMPSLLRDLEPRSVRTMVVHRRPLRHTRLDWQYPQGWAVISHARLPNVAFKQTHC